MFSQPVPLTRYFSLVPKSEESFEDQEFLRLFGDLKRTVWSDIEKLFRCVILAEAGAGKSYEMESRAKRLKNNGFKAFLIRIEDIEADFESSFEVGDKSSFEEWLDSSGEAWFFLDSVDEARLENPRKFEKAIKRFGNRINSACQRAHVYISSRPYAWRKGLDCELLKKYLPYSFSDAGEVGEVECGNQEDIQYAVGNTKNELPVYRMDPLDESDIKEFSKCRGIKQEDKLILELKRKNLMHVASRPFDLEAILEKWKDDGKLDGRLKLIEHTIERHLNEFNPDRIDRHKLSAEKARNGARLLAAAVVLTGEAGIRVPGSTIHDSGVKAEVVLRDWEPAEIKSLLELGIFNDRIYGMVRFRHREVRELLAAEWFRECLHAGMPRGRIKSLFIRERYGHMVITPRLRPVLSWFILFNEEIRDSALEIAPEIAVEGGDAASLPKELRAVLLNSIVERIVKGVDDRTACDNSAIARIAAPDLSDEALKLIGKYFSNEDAIFYLGRLAWQGEMVACVPVLADMACNVDRNVYSRLASTRAVAACGTSEQKINLWTRLNEAKAALPREVLRELVQYAEVDLTTLKLLEKSFELVEAYERFKATGLTQALHGFVDRIPISIGVSESETLVDLINILSRLIKQEPHVQPYRCYISSRFAWLYGLALHLVERLAAVCSRAALYDESIDIMLKLPEVKNYLVEVYDWYKSDLNRIVREWSELNDTLFWRSVERERGNMRVAVKKEITSYADVAWIGHAWGFDGGRFIDVLDFISKREKINDKLVAFTLAKSICNNSGNQKDWLEKLENVAAENGLGESCVFDDKSASLNAESEAYRKQALIEAEQERVNQDQKCRKLIESVKNNPDYFITHPSFEVSSLSEDLIFLIEEVSQTTQRESASSSSNWKALIPMFGDDVAQAYRNAATLYWRKYTPKLKSEDSKSYQFTYEFIFGMSGLEIEATENSDFPKNLNEQEARHVLRYLVNEINGFPHWFESVFREFKDLVLSMLFDEICWELSLSDTDQVRHYVLDILESHVTWVCKYLAPNLLEWMKNNEIVDDLKLRTCISILLSNDTDGQSLLGLARLKIESAQINNQLPIWYALLADLNAAQAIEAVDIWLSSLPEECASLEAQKFLTSLRCIRKQSQDEQYCVSDISAKDIKTLYLMMSIYLLAEDSKHEEGVVYEVDLQEEALRCRNALLNLLSEKPGKASYDALIELAQVQADEKHRKWFEKLAMQRALDDSDIDLWSDEQVCEFDKRKMIVPTTNAQLFDLIVDRLVDLKDWVEQGNDSPYETWRSAKSENEVRNLVAGWLRMNSLGSYTCSQENELANSQRTDILVHSTPVSSPVPIELKLLDKKWSGEDLCERLRNQLVGDYLREEDSCCGVMLLVWQGKSSPKDWVINGNSVGLSSIVDALTSYWTSIKYEYTGIATVKVILIDLTIRELKSNN